MELQTERLRLVLETTEEILTRIADMSPADQAQVSPAWLARLRGSDAADPWTHGFRVVDRASGVTVGSCAYKDLPDEGGAVEIAYFVAPDQQGRGCSPSVAVCASARSWIRRTAGSGGGRSGGNCTE